VAHYPDVLNKMDGDLDWTTALGQAYVNQSDDVMTSVQRLRRRLAPREPGHDAAMEVEDSGGH